MKKISRVFLLIAALAALTVAAAVLRLSVRENVPEGSIQIETSGEVINVLFSEQQLTNVKGTIVNGKGEEKIINAQGILLADFLNAYQISGFDEVVVEADDAYSAVVTAEEVAAPEKVYLTAQENGGVKMVVFGDANSKRSVSDVVRIKVQ